MASEAWQSASSSAPPKRGLANGRSSTCCCSTDFARSVSPYSEARALATVATRQVMVRRDGPPEVPPAEPSRDGQDPDPSVVSSALVGHALTGDDRLELESMCRQLAEHADQGVRDTAGLCLGNIGRRFGEHPNRKPLPDGARDEAS